MVGTFLTTSKMNPALVARIEASVTGRKPRVSGGKAAKRPTVIAIARLAGVAVVVALLVLIATRWERQTSLLDEERAALLSDVERERNALDTRHHQLVSRVEALLVEAADSDDIVSAELADTERLGALLSEPMVYLRTPRKRFVGKPNMSNVARDAVKDTFLLCLLEPPKEETEKAYLDKVGIVFAGGLEARSQHVRRLQAAVLGLPFLTRDWMKTVEDASSLIEVGKLRTAFDKAPLEHAQQAARSELLLYVFDDEPAPDAVSELDGTAAHDVRVGLVHIPSGKPYFRVRAQVDPAWISEKNRPEMARGLTGCRLAVDVRKRAVPPSDTPG